MAWCSIVRLKTNKTTFHRVLYVWKHTKIIVVRSLNRTGQFPVHSISTKHDGMTCRTEHVSATWANRFDLLTVLACHRQRSLFLKIKHEATMTSVEADWGHFVLTDVIHAAERTEKVSPKIISPGKLLLDHFSVTLPTKARTQSQRVRDPTCVACLEIMLASVTTIVAARSWYVRTSLQ